MCTIGINGGDGAGRLSGSSLGIALLLVLSSAAQAVTIAASDRGHYRIDGRHQATNKTPIAGLLNPNQYRSFFVFDLAGLAGTVDDALLRLELQFYFAPFDASQTLDVFDVSASAADLAVDRTSPLPDVAGQVIFADLGTGNIYGTFTVAAADVGSVIDIPLSAQAISDIDAALGDTFAIGVRLREPFTGTQDIVRFSDTTEPRIHELVLSITEPESEPADNLPVPEPTQGVALALLATAIHRARQKRGLAKSHEMPARRDLSA